MIHRRKAILFGMARMSLLLVYGLFLSVQVCLRYTSEEALDTDGLQNSLGKSFYGIGLHKALSPQSGPEAKHILNKRFQPVDSPGMPPQESRILPLFTFVQLFSPAQADPWSRDCRLAFRLRGPPSVA